MITRKVGAFEVLLDDDSPFADAPMHIITDSAGRHVTVIKHHGQRRKLLHRCIVPVTGGVVDALNGNLLDCRRENLFANKNGEEIITDFDGVEVVEFGTRGKRKILYNGEPIGTFRITRKGFYESTFTGTPRYYSSPDQVIQEAINAHARTKPRRYSMAMDQPGAATIRALFEACGHTVVSATA